MKTDRIRRFQEALQAQGFTAAAIVPGANLYYLTDLAMHLSERLTLLFVPAVGDSALLLPALEAPRAQAQSYIPLRLYTWNDAEGPALALQRCAADLGLEGGRVAIEHTAMRVLDLRALEEAAAVQTEDVTPILAGLRMAKDADELAAMRAAVRVVEQSLRATIAQARPGVTERQLAAIWDHEMRAAGAEPSFGTIVASGPHAANPHHTNSDRAFQSGDLIILDGGALVAGYASDITRTIAVGLLPAEARRIYELTLAANAAARAAARPGATGEEIDRAARDVISAGGYGPQFLHRTGHGLGLEIHEPPYIVAGNRAPLPLGATFTIEPGIYVAGLGGVRIEDDVVITADGAESLTTFERELITIAWE